MQTYIQCRRKAQFHRWQYIVGILGYSSQNHSPSCRNNHQEWPVQLYWILSHRQLFDSLGMQWKGSSQPWPCQESGIEWDWMLQILCYYLRRLKKSHMVPVLSRSREFYLFLDVHMYHVYHVHFPIFLPFFTKKTLNRLVKINCFRK